MRCIPCGVQGVAPHSTPDDLGGNPTSMNGTTVHVIPFVDGRNCMPKDGPPLHIRQTVAVMGGVFAVGGLVGIGLVVRGHKNPYLLEISTTALVVGVVLIGQSILSKRSSADDQTYRIGYDVGYEKGERDERERTNPVVVPFKKFRRLRDR